jgi:MscS family membrane protein
MLTAPALDVCGAIVPSARWDIDSGGLAAGPGSPDAISGAMAFVSFSPDGAGSWIEQHLPPIALRVGPAGLSLWQWLALPLTFCLAWLAGIVLSRVTRAVLALIARRTATTYDDQLLGRLSGPLTLAWTAIVELVALPFLALDAAAHEVAKAPLKAGILVAFFWALLRGADAVLERMETSNWAVVHPAARSLLPLVRRIATLCVAALGVTALLAELGYPVTSLIAGLGIGGLAFALAAQKTVENLFGAVSLGLDRPFVVGDFVKVEDFVGTVEEIGFRSTRIRTLDRTLISLPNGKLAEMRIESFAARDRLRFAMNLALNYGTTAAQLRQVIERVERTLKEHPKVWPEGTAVKLKELGEAGLIIEVNAWFSTLDWNEFTVIRQDTLIAFLQIVEEAGTSFAFPPRGTPLVLPPTLDGAAPEAVESP